MIFLSHSSADKPRLQPVVDALKSNEIQVWFDQSSITYGGNILRKISEGLEQSEKLLVGWSKHAEASDHVWNEISGFYMHHPGGESILFHVLDETPIPTIFSARRYFYTTGDHIQDATIISGWISNTPTEPIADLQHGVSEIRLLRKLPRGPIVPFTLITGNLISAYADTFSLRAKAVMVINKAIQLRRDADPDDSFVTTIEQHFLPNIDAVGSFPFWQPAFEEACKHGPRMVGAMLLAEPDDLFPEAARKDRARLLQYLQSINQQSEHS